VNPVDRIGQVSGLADLVGRYSLVGIGLLAGLVAAHVLGGGRWFPTAERIACAATAGLASALVGGAVVMALRGTWMPLMDFSDSTNLEHWSSQILHGQAMRSDYPPGFPWLLAEWARYVTHGDTTLALRHLQFIVTALFYPAAYLAWRPLFRPIWALAVGVVPALVLIEPFKPYSNLVLVVSMPLFVLFIRRLRTIAGLPYPRVLGIALGFGTVFGLLCLTYSGWFVWSLGGLGVAACIVFPWRGDRRRGAAFVLVALSVFCAIAGSLLYAQVTSPDTGAGDYYLYFDTYVEPAYIAMWTMGFYSDAGPVWPLRGELGGVGLFTLVLLAGSCGAVALGLRRSLVVTVVPCLLASWMLRFWICSDMSRSHSVRLWPRTAIEILYCLLVLCVFALVLAARQVAGLVSSLRDRGLLSGPVVRNGSAPAVIGAFLALMLLFASAGSSTANRYMPRNDSSPGRLSWLAQSEILETGHCSRFVPPASCASGYRTP
jgi:hypothetical protein